MLTEGEEIQLHCPEGQYVDFTYGRYFRTGCGADVTRKLQTNCCKQRSCLIQATNGWLGIDPCYGDEKTLAWNAICQGTV